MAVIVEAATDNKNRTAAEIRRIFSKNDGNLGTSGSVSYMFHKKGRITVPRSAIAEERIFELALEAGAEELTTEEEEYVITTSHDQLYAVAEALKHAGVTTEWAKVYFHSRYDSSGRSMRRSRCRSCACATASKTTMTFKTSIQI